MVNSNKQKSALLAFVLGLFFPGLGLLYAAPWLVGGVAIVFTLAVFKLIGWIPVIGSVAMGLLAISSGMLNVLYAREYNRHGRRITIAEAAGSLES